MLQAVLRIQRSKYWKTGYLNLAKKKFKAVTFQATLT